MITVRFLTTSFHLGPVFLEILDNIKWLNMIKVALYMRQVKVTSKVIHLKPACPTSGSLNPAADATILAATSDSTSKSYSNVWKTSRQTYRFDTCWQPAEDGNNTFKRILRRSETKIWLILCLLTDFRGANKLRTFHPRCRGRDPVCPTGGGVGQPLYPGFPGPKSAPSQQPPETTSSFTCALVGSAIQIACKCK